MKHAGPTSRHGFTLVEMLVVIGIMGIIISLLLPTLAKARAQSEKVVCISNLHQMGVYMSIYLESNNGYLFPPNMGFPSKSAIPAGANPAEWEVNPFGPGFNHLILGTTPIQKDVWPYYVVRPQQWNPKVMLCPSDQDPLAEHSYLANAYLEPKSMPPATAIADPSNTSITDLRYESKLPPGHTPSDVIVMGEKLTFVADLYMSPGDFGNKVEQHRHGLSVGSNYLMLDMHVETMVPFDAQNSLDPWDFGTPPTP